MWQALMLALFVLAIGLGPAPAPAQIRTDGGRGTAPAPGPWTGSPSTPSRRLTNQADCERAGSRWHPAQNTCEPGG
jgi:hypothetical protein